MKKKIRKDFNCTGYIMYRAVFIDSGIADNFGLRS